MKRHSIVPRALGLLLCLALALSLAPTAWAAKPQAAASTNLNAQNYNDTYHASTTKSYLYENASGGLTRVEYIYDYSTGGRVVVEDYDSGFVLRSSRTIAPELPVWGGFFAGESCNFLVFGQENKEENDGKEVVRIVKYDKNWNRLGSASLYGANTIVPFRSGSLRCAEYGGRLYIRASHQMYTARDGKNHQASMMLLVRESDMKITDSLYLVETGPGYVSHSFNQFILIDRANNIITLDHGDGSPRSIVLSRFIAKAGQDTFREERYVETASGPGWAQGYITCEDRVDVQAFPGIKGANDTGCSVGGLAETSQGYVTAYSYDGLGRRFDPRDIYFAFAGKDLSVKTSRITTDVSASTPQLASTGPDGGYILWNQNEIRYTPMGGSYTEMGDTLYYARYDANGTVGAVRTATAPLSDCQPIAYNGKVVWYVTNNSAPTFYALDGSGVQTMVSDARSRFTDLAANAYYLDPVAWAVNRGITTGRTATTFAPTQTCTHGEILTFLWRAAGKPASGAQPPIEMTGKEFYYDAARWAAEKGMIAANFNPNAPCNRAYAVLYIWQAFDKPAPSAASPFTDVPAHWSSAPAVAWAVEKGVTTGKTATTFNPAGICSRGEIVTFLHRAYS